MRLVPDDDVHGWRSEQALLLDLPSGGRQQRMPRRRQGGEVGHGRAGREAAARAGREAEQLEEPARCHLFGHGSGR